MYASYVVPRGARLPQTNYGYAAGSPPSFVQDMETVGRAIKLEEAQWKDNEIVIPLNHWERRFTLPVTAGLTTTFSTPLFDFWYDHLVEEGLPSTSVVTGAGGGMAFGGASGPGPGTSPSGSLQWQNNIYDYMLKIVTASIGASPITVTLKGGMNLQSSDEPVTISTMTVTNELLKSDQTVVISGRVPMRFLRFDWSFVVSSTPPSSFDIIQQIGVRCQ